MTNTVSDPLSRPNCEFKRARLAARISLAILATGGGLDGRPFFPFLFLVTSVHVSGMKSDKVMGARDTFGIGPIHGFTTGFGF